MGTHRRHPDGAAGEAAGGSQDHASQLDAKARDWLAEKGYDPAYGARPLKRAIQKAVQDPLAELILSGKVKDGEKVAISADKQGITFNGEVGSRRRKRLARARLDTLGVRFESHAEVMAP